MTYARGPLYTEQAYEQDAWETGPVDETNPHYDTQGEPTTEWVYKLDVEIRATSPQEAWQHFRTFLDAVDPQIALNGGYLSEHDPDEL